jgi:hypothetical protein
MLHSELTISREASEGNKRGAWWKKSVFHSLLFSLLSV